jgi:hypothetical protein
MANYTGNRIGPAARESAAPFQSVFHRAVGELAARWWRNPADCVAGPGKMPIAKADFSLCAAVIYW